MKQDALKFTDLWLEYAQIDQGFYFANADPYAWTLSISPFLYETGLGYMTYWDTTVLNVVARQKWNDQWWTYVRYLDVDTDDDDSTYQDYTASVRYNYTPNLWFELGFDQLEADDYSDNMIWFRTTVNF